MSYEFERDAGRGDDGERFDATSWTPAARAPWSPNVADRLFANLTPSELNESYETLRDRYPASTPRGERGARYERAFVWEDFDRVAEFYAYCGRYVNLDAYVGRPEDSPDLVVVRRAIYYEYSRAACRDLLGLDAVGEAFVETARCVAAACRRLGRYLLTELEGAECVAEATRALEDGGRTRCGGDDAVFRTCFDVGILERDGDRFGLAWAIRAARAYSPPVATEGAGVRRTPAPLVEYAGLDARYVVDDRAEPGSVSFALAHPSLAPGPADAYEFVRAALAKGGKGRTRVGVCSNVRATRFDHLWKHAAAGATTRRPFLFAYLEPTRTTTSGADPFRPKTLTWASSSSADPAADATGEVLAEYLANPHRYGRLRQINAIEYAELRSLPPDCDDVLVLIDPDVGDALALADAQAVSRRVVVLSTDPARRDIALRTCRPLPSKIRPIRGESSLFGKYRVADRKGATAAPEPSSSSDDEEE